MTTVLASPVRLFSGPDDSTLQPARDVLRLGLERGLVPIAPDVQPRSATYEDVYEQVELLKSGEVEDEDGHVVGTTILKAFKGKQRWKTGRQKPSRLPGQWIQKWTSTFSEFLESYSGIVEVVKGADQQFGGVAYGTLSVLLAIPLHKEQHEKEIEDALDEFALAFPRLQNLKDIYPEKSKSLKMLVAKIYREIMVFCWDSIDYYATGRVKHTALHPPKMRIQPQVAVIRRLLAETRWESEVLMQQQIRDLVQNTVELKQHSRDLEQKLSELYALQSQRQQNDDQKALLSFKVALRIEVGDQHVNAKRYRGLLDEAFADIFLEQDCPYKMTTQRFEAEPSVARWLHPSTSGVLSLAGQNSNAINHTTLCWLSYAACLVPEMFTAADDIVAMYFCQVTPMMSTRNWPFIRDVVMSWVYQIATSKPSVLRNGFKDITRLFAEDTWSEDAEDALQAIGPAFLALLSSLDAKTRVTLVLDRADQCCLSRGVEPSRREVDQILDWLISLAGKAPCVLKILVIMHDRPSRNVLTVARRKRTAAVDKGLFIETLDWHQDKEP